MSRPDVVAGLVALRPAALINVPFSVETPKVETVIVEAVMRMGRGTPARELVTRVEPVVAVTVKVDTSKVEVWRVVREAAPTVVEPAMTGSTVIVEAVKVEAVATGTRISPTVRLPVTVDALSVEAERNDAVTVEVLMEDSKVDPAVIEEAVSSPTIVMVEP